MFPPPSGTSAVDGADGADPCRLDLLRERQRRATGEFHLERALHDLTNHFHAIELRVSFLAGEKGNVLATPAVLEELAQCCTSARERIEALKRTLPSPPEEPARTELQPILALAAALARRDRGTVVLAPAIAALPPVRGRAEELSVAFVHLFDNAREAHGRVHVDGAADDGGVTLRVSDDGDGIPDEIVARVWKPFFTTKSGGHKGHGLALVQKIVRREGGAIELSPGGGAHFVVRLPR